MLRVAITTLGCKVNQVDAIELLQAVQGVVVEVPFHAQADLYIVNSCTVTATADRQSRQLCHRARRTNPEGRVVLTGCLAAVASEEDLERLGVDRVFPLREHHLLTRYIQDLAGSGAAATGRSLRHKARPFVKIQDGCDHACSYCIVPAARGPSRSVATPEEVMRALAELAAGGAQEVVLTGIHLGRYGLDLDPPSSLAALMAESAASVRIRLSSIEPDELTEELIRSMVERPERICPHLHVPIQSGDDTILAAMNRPYRAELIRDLLADLRARIPDVALGTDLIAGFPGETDAQHQASLRLVRESPLTHLHAFPFSPRPGTPAARLPQLPRRLRADRARDLRTAGNDKLSRFAAAQLGRTRRVLIERAVTLDGERLLLGVTDNYLRVRVKSAAEELVGRLVDVQLTALVAGEGVAVTGRL